MEHIDRVFYINLDKRPDRNISIQYELSRMGIPSHKIERFSAFEYGQIGCAMSHKRVLQIAQERGYKNIFIFEDDFQFTVSSDQFKKELSTFFEKSYSRNFQVLMCNYLCKKCVPLDSQLSIARQCSDASAYLANYTVFAPLIQTLEEGNRLLSETGEHWNYMNDQIWKRLQDDGTNKWFMLNKPVGKQSDSQSNLANQTTYIFV